MFPSLIETLKMISQELKQKPCFCKLTPTNCEYLFFYFHHPDNFTNDGSLFLGLFGRAVATFLILLPNDCPDLNVPIYLHQYLLSHMNPSN